MSAQPDLTIAAEALCKERGYRFRGKLGQGAFKSAFLVDSPDGQCALKLAVVSGPPDRLLRETQALQGCSHPCISRLIEAFPHQYGSLVLWVVREEFLPGGTLEARLSDSILAPGIVRVIGVRLAEVLGHLHERRLVHRDIKPANILFRTDPTVPVLTDFGVVRMLDEPTLTRGFAQMGPGTPAYAAPEQLNNEKAQIDWRTDQFGLAVVLAECLTGHHPFQLPNTSLYDAIYAVTAKQPLPDSTASELTSLGFPSLVTALQPWPVGRFRKPSQFIEVLGRA